MDNSNYRHLTVENSSNIQAIEYLAGDPEINFGTLTILFHNGGAYRYTNFGAQLAEEFFATESKGKFFHSKIRNHFVGVKVEEVPEEPTETRFSRQRELETEATGKLESESVIAHGLTRFESEFEEEDEKIQVENFRRVPLASKADEAALVKAGLNKDLPERYVESVEEKADDGEIF